MRPLAALLEELARLGVVLEAAGDKLRVQAPPGNVDAALRAELAARKQELLDHLTAPQIPSDAAQHPVARIDSNAAAPLTFNQRRLWFIEKLGGSGNAFVMTGAWHIHGLDDSAALRRALARLIQRHAALRMRIVEHDGEVQQIAEAAPALTIAEQPATADQIEGLIATEAAQPFDLEQDRLFRLRLFRIDQQSRHLLLFSLHHIVGDRWSVGILLRDLGLLIQQESMPANAQALPALPLQFGDFAAWQQERESPAALANGLDYWRQQLSGAPGDIALPLDRPRPAMRSQRGAACRFTLPAAADLVPLAAKVGASPFMAYLALYAALLARWSGQDDIVIGCPAGSREFTETHDVIGFFVNTVALRLDLSDDPDFLTLLARARSASLAAFAHQDVPFDRIVDALQPARRLNANPLFQAMFVLQNAMLAPLTIPGATVEAASLPPMAPEVDFNLALEPPATPGAGFGAYLEYDPALFEPETAARFGRHFADLALAVAAKPDLPLSQLMLTDEPGASWLGAEIALPAESLDQLILARLRAAPEATAVIEADGSRIEAGRLAERALAVAAILTAQGIAAGQVVGLHLPRGADLVAAMLGCLHAGATFVILPPDAPAEHLQRIRSMAQPDLVLDHGIATLPAPVMAPAWLASNAPAYLCFTSGTSGQPKGIRIGRPALLNHALAVAQAFALVPQDRVLQFAAPGFDVALEEILPTLLAGAAIVIPPAEALDALDAFGQCLAQRGVSVANLPAPFWHAWLRDMIASGSRPPASLRLLITGSDRVHAEAARQWQSLAPNCRWLSGYGPSEATITATLFDPAQEALSDALATVPLGQPLANVCLHLVDVAGNPVPAGFVGEIVIEGAGLADGYLAADGGAAFRPRSKDGPPAYWTGDLGRRTAGGALEFLGRRDSQLKIRGIRIEPAAIEAVLAAHPQAGDVAVTGRPDGHGGLVLCASITGTAAPATLRQWAMRQLPQQQVPAVIEQVATLPRTASGKIDRRSLAARPLPVQTDSVQRLDGEREQLIGGIFAQVLARDDIGPNSNFFGLGGDSIRSLQVVSQARRAGLAITARMIFEHQTVAAIAAAATPLGAENEGPSGLGPQPFTPISAWFHQEVTVDWHHFNQTVMLALPQPPDLPALQAALAAIVARHDMLRITVIEGPPLRHEIPASVAAPELEIVPLAGFTPAMQEQEKARCIAAAQASLDPRQGRNLAAVLFPEDGHLLLTLHHLSIDVLSWGILLEDFEAAYRQASLGGTPRLPPVPTPFRLWAERLDMLARSDAVAGDLDFWLARLSQSADRLLPQAGDDPGLEASARSVRRSVERAVTSDLMRAAPAAFGVRTDEILLGALQMVLRRRGGTRLRVDLERNGRISPFADLDLSRTIGWFTAMLPLLLDQDERDIPAMLGGIARAIADIPQDGLGYGLLRYLAAGEAPNILASLPRAELLLNFVGQLSHWNEGPFKPVDADTGPTIAPTIPRSHMLELNAGVIDGQLRLEMNYSAAAVDAGAVGQLLDEIAVALRDIASAARRTRIGGDLPADVEDILPLTPLQRGMMLHGLRQPETYFDQIRLTLDGPLDKAALRAAWRSLVARHQILRASFRFGADGQPIQLIHAAADPDWITLDWRQHTPEQQQSRIKLLMQADRIAGFDLARPPLLRLHLIHLGDNRHELLWSAHHLLADGWSVSVLMAEFTALYRGDLLPAAPPFGRYVQWLAEIDRPAAQRYWAETLARLEAPIPLAEALAGLPADGMTDESVSVMLQSAEIAAIEALARHAGVTIGIVLQAAWALLLGRHAGSAEALFGITVSGRPPELAGSDAMVGMLINTLPVRITLPDDLPVLAWLKRIALQAAERASHAALPLPEILEAAGLTDAALPFDSLLLVQNYPRPARLDAGAMTIGLAQVVEATELPVTLVADWPQGEQAPVRLSLQRNGRQLPYACGDDLLRRLRHVLASMAATPAANLGSINLLDAAERTQMLALAQGPKLTVPSPYLPQILAHWADLIPSAPAVSAKDGVLSYRDLEARSNALAAYLVAQGLRPGDHAVLAVPRSAAAITGFFAILKAGAAVVPLDIGYPAERLRFVLEDSAPAMVLSDSGHAALLPMLSGAMVIAVDELSLDEATDWQPPSLDETATAYVIYTSGSTGQPKGVLSPHGGLRALVAAQRHIFGLGPGDRVLQFASLSFDAAVWEIAMAIGAGAALHVPDRQEALAGPELAQWLRDQRITAATLPPSLLAVLPEGRYADLNILIVAGEACPPHLAQRWASNPPQERHLGRRFFNGYGPSEATICATLHEGGGDGQTIPIGRPIPNVAAYVLDSRLQPVPPGCAGELVIGGLGVGTGYLGRPDLTAQSFLPDPFDGSGAGRIYRSGDRVRLRSDSTLVFLGRIDRQVKLRGFRIEPGEVEAALAAQPGIAQALAGLRQDRQGEPQLLAWILPAPGNAAPDPALLRQALKTQLPSHMLPAAIIPINAVPLTRNGKVDWPALPAPADAAPQTPSPKAPPPIAAWFTPEDWLLQQLRGIWQQLLDRPHIGPEENFFDLGGHSLLLVRLRALLQQQFNHAPPINTLFAHPTLRSLTRHLLQLGVQPPQAAAPESEPADVSRAADPIAVIGMAGRFPGAPDLEAYWRLLLEAREGLQRFDAATLRAAGRSMAETSRPGFVAAGGFLAEADCFDHAVFGLNPRDALILDPQHRVFLQCAWHALEHAGYAPGKVEASIGLFAGSGYNTWLREMLVPAGEQLSGSGGFHLITGNDKDFLASQVAYRLDLKGPVVNVQTACSTSLVAVAMAVEALQAGRCAMALAGGVAIPFPQQRGYQYEPDMILSPDGHCRPFSALAAGTVPSAGAGAVLLKPLARAQADGDRILAVIRGAAVNNDGARKMGYTAPGVAGQADVISRALAAAGLQRDDVDYIEAHGTGTALGDPVEVTALARAYGGRRQPLLLGSVKGNIGHADSAAGIAGLIKTVLALQHGQLPASLHALPSNPQIDWTAGPFDLVTETRPWPRRDRPQRAGISSFGIGGTNAHVILEAAPTREIPTAPASDQPQILPLSAQSETALQQQSRQLADYLRHNPQTALADIAHGLQTGRAALRQRRTIVARSSAEAVALLERPGGITQAGKAPSLAWLFPGQGSQHPGMGQALYQAGGVFRQEFDALSAAMEQPLGQSLAALLYGPDAADAAALRATDIAQPALFVTSLALARHWQALGLRPDGMLGHSIGEYVAAYLAGVFTLEDAMRLVVQRGRQVAALPGGAMLALDLPEAEALALLAETGSAAVLAASNGPALSVVSGPVDAIASLATVLQQRGIAARPLHTSHAFHSPMLAPAAEALAAAITRCTLQAPRLPFISNVTGTWITPAQATDPAYWAEQLLAPVRFAEGIATLRASGITLAVEAGPGQVLTALGRSNGLATLPSLGHAAADPAGGMVFYASIADLWRQGIDIDWRQLHDQPRQRLALPLYPFDPVPHRPKPQPATSSITDLTRQPMPAWFYRPAWLPAGKTAAPLDGPWLILADRAGLGDAVAAHLRSQGQAVMVVEQGAAYAQQGNDRFTARAGNTEDFTRLLQELPVAPCRLLHLWCLDDGDTAAQLEAGLHSLLALIAATGRVLPGASLRLDLVSRMAWDLGATDTMQPLAAAAIGALQVLPVEYPELAVHAFDLPADSTADEADLLLQELACGGEDSVIALRDGLRWKTTMQPTPLLHGSYKPPANATILITGGFGGMGAALAHDLAGEPGIKLVLQGRQAVPARAEWPQALHQGGEIARRIALMQTLEAAGAEVLCVTLDLADAAAVQAMVAQASQRFGAISGVIHAAGLADWGGVVQNRQRDATDQVLAPKIHGTLALEAALAGQKLDFLVLCSTLGSFLPAAKFGQVAYAAANQYLDMAAADIAARRGWRCVVINWDDWIEAGMTVAAHRAKGLAEPQATDGLSDTEGAAVLRRILAGPYRQVAVSVRDLPRLMAEARQLFAPHLEAINVAVSNTAAVMPAISETGLLGELTAAFQRVLSDPAFGPDDNFFERGGHSLLAMQLLAFLRDRLGYIAGIAMIFDHPTPRRLADHLQNHAAHRASG